MIDKYSILYSACFPTIFIECIKLLSDVVRQLNETVLEQWFVSKFDDPDKEQDQMCKEIRSWISAIYDVIGELALARSSQYSTLYFFDSSLHTALWDSSPEAHPVRSQIAGARLASDLSDLFNNLHLLEFDDEHQRQYVEMLGLWWRLYFVLVDVAEYLVDLPVVASMVKRIVGRMVSRRLDFAAELSKSKTQSRSFDWLRETDHALLRKFDYALLLAETVDRGSNDHEYVNSIIDKLNTATVDDMKKAQTDAAQKDK